MKISYYDRNKTIISDAIRKIKQEGITEASLFALLYAGAVTHRQGTGLVWAQTEAIVKEALEEPIIPDYTGIYLRGKE